MSKSTLFIAVQCCQCSTMQVKQQKKSSNKWNCAVCNEKQSVRKVYAQGYQAKDIRQVVQSFNMSRKFADDQELEYHESSQGHFVEHLECNQDTAEEEQKKAKRRNDWTEYVDFDEDSLEPAYLKSKLQGKEGFEEKVVTELPEELVFKKPKLKGGFGSANVKTGENQTYKPQFSKKSGASRAAAAVVKEVTETGPVSVSSGWTADRNNVDFSDHCRVISSQSQQRQQKCKGAAVLKRGASRWAEYLAEDDADCCQGEGMPFTDDLSLKDGYKVVTDDADLLVEEDIHPDFM